MKKERIMKKAIGAAIIACTLFTGCSVTVNTDDHVKEQKQTWMSCKDAWWNESAAHQFNAPIPPRYDAKKAEQNIIAICGQPPQQ